MKPVERADIQALVEALPDARSCDELYRNLSTKRVKRNGLQLKYEATEPVANEEYARLLSEIECLETGVAQRKARTVWISAWLPEEYHPSYATAGRQ